MREMKNSGIEWIGDIPADWNVGRTKNCYTHKKQIAGDVAEQYERLALTLNGVIKRPKDDAVGLQPEAFDGYQILQANELVFKLIDLENVSTSRVGYSPYTGIVSPAYIVLTPREPDESKYGEYFFMSMWQREVFNHIGDDGVRSSLNAKDLLDISYLCIPNSQKRKIADYLDCKCAEIDAVIEKTKATIEEYKKLRQQIIIEAITKGIDKHCKMKESGIDWIGKVPLETEIIKIKYVTDISRGLFNHRPRNDERYYGGRYPFIQTGDVARAGKFITTYSQTLNELGISVSKLFPKGTMTMTIAANIGDVAILGFDAYFPDSVVGFTPKQGYFENYIYYLFCSMKEMFMRTAVVSTQLNLNIERIKELFVPIIKDIDKQKEIANYLDKKCAEIDTLIAKKTTLLEEMENYKKSVIYEYVTGKKAVL